MGIVSWQEGLDFGFGFDDVRGEPMQRGVDGTVAVSPGAAGEAGGTGFVLVNSITDFDSVLNIQAGVNVGIGLFGGAAKFNFRQKCKVSNQATFCVLWVVSKHAFEQIQEPQLTKDATDLLKARNTTRFRERFGDCFVSGRQTGVEFYGVIRIEASSVGRQLEIAAGLKASYGFFNTGEGEVDVTQSMSSSQHKIEALTYQRGGLIRACTSLNDLSRLAEAALQEGRAGRGYPFEVMLDPYSELRLPYDDLSLVKVEQAQRCLRRLMGHLDTFRKTQNDIDFVLHNQEWFELDATTLPRLNQLNAEISREINVIVDKADACSLDFTRCEDYSPTIPAVDIPPRKADAPQMAVTLLEVPDLGGLLKANAVATLQLRNLVAATTDMPSVVEAVGTVVGQAPAPGARVSPGSTVTLQIGSSGGGLGRLR